MPSPMGTDYEALNNAFTAMIDSIIPPEFGRIHGNDEIKHGRGETADDIIERNKARRKAERHRSIISSKNPTATPSSSSSAASMLPLHNTLKRRHEGATTTNPSETGTLVGHGLPRVQHEFADHSQVSEDEDESRSRIVKKRPRVVAKDAFGVKKAKVNKATSLKPVGPVGARQQNDVTNPFRLGGGGGGTDSPTIPKPSNLLFSTASPVSPSVPHADTVEEATVSLPTEESMIESSRTASPSSAASRSIPPPELHGKDRKRWLKKQRRRAKQNVQS